MVEHQIGAHTGAFQACIRRGASRHQFGPPYHPRQPLQGCAHETVAGGVDRKNLEPARHTRTSKQLASFGPEQIDAAAYPSKVAARGLKREAEVPPQSQLDRTSEYLRCQVRNLVWVVLGTDPLGRWELSVQVGRIQHQQPQVPDRNLAHLRVVSMSLQFCRVGRRRLEIASCHQKSSSSLLAWSSAVLVSSNQYSRSNGAISVSTTSLNQEAASSILAPRGVVT